MGMPHDLNLIINRMKIVILFNDEKCIIVDMAKFSEKKKSLYDIYGRGLHCRDFVTKAKPKLRIKLQLFKFVKNFQ